MCGNTKKSDVTTPKKKTNSRELNSIGYLVCACNYIKYFTNHTYSQNYTLFLWLAPLRIHKRLKTRVIIKGGVKINIVKKYQGLGNLLKEIYV